MHLDRLVDLSFSYDYSSGHDNYSHGYYSLEGHIQGLSLTSDQHYSVGYCYGHILQLERFASTSY